MLTNKQLFSNRQKQIPGSILSPLFHPVCNWTMLRNSLFSFHVEGTECFLAQMRAQKVELLERLSSARNFSNMDDEDSYSAASKSSAAGGELLLPLQFMLALLDASYLFSSSKVYVAGSSVDSHNSLWKCGHLFLVTLMAFPFSFPCPTKSIGSCLPIRPVAS